jgi:hypothetical protein
MKNFIFKTFAILTFLFIAGSGAFAQVITSRPTFSIASDTSSVADTVSIGAVMPYYVNPDAGLRNSPLYNSSGFQWNFNGSGITGLTKTNGTALVPSPVAASGFYTDSMVMATMPGTAGNITMSVLERSNPKFSATAGCNGNPRNLVIHVMSLPSVPSIAIADTAQGGCSSATDYTVKFDFSASTTKFPVYVSFTIKAFDINNNPVGTASNLLYEIKNASKHIELNKATYLDAVSTNGVRYTITLDKVWDRISSRATNSSLLGVNASALKAAIMILPSPKTGIIKHIKTL